MTNPFARCNQTSKSSSKPFSKPVYSCRKLISIELSNFKSFYGRHLIGPFSKLTGVIGPNGGGKLVSSILCGTLVDLKSMAKMKSEDEGFRSCRKVKLA